MLVLSRRSHESILIKLADGAAGNLTLRELFVRGPIEIMLLGTDGRRFKMGISAPSELAIRRKDDNASNAE